MIVNLANPRGFCAGVDRAIDIVKKAIEIHGRPIYVRHEVVHNKFVVADLTKKGAVFVEEIDQVPDGSTLIFSAHGVSQEVRKRAEARNLEIFDATCPLVTKVHLEVKKFSKEGIETVLIGHAGHPEVEGTMGQYEDKSKIFLVESIEEAKRINVKNRENVAYVTQTTLSVDDTREIISALRNRFPNIIGPRKDDICYATQNRQNAVKKITKECDLLIVVGSFNSSNSNRLKEIADKKSIQSHLIDGPDSIKPSWLKGKNKIGVTAGASAPEELVQRVIERLKNLGAQTILESSGKEENIVFSLPITLR